MLVGVELSTLVVDRVVVARLGDVLGAKGTVLVALDVGLALELTGSTPAVEPATSWVVGPAIPVVVVEAIGVGSDP